MSRNPHEPSAETRRQVRSLSGVGLPQEDIAVIVGCSEKTLRLYYRHELDEGAADANAAIVEALHGQIRRGNVTAMIFFEKAKGGKREKIKEEVSIPEPRPIPHEIVAECSEESCDKVDEYRACFVLGIGDPGYNVEKLNRAIEIVERAIGEEKC